jgi:NhaP-type Na+/H+ and K+/H+ antiporter
MVVYPVANFIARTLSATSRTLAPTTSGGTANRSPADPQDGDAERALHYHTLVLPPDTPAVGQAVRALDLPRGVLLITIERDYQTLIPQGGTVLDAGDVVTILAPAAEMAAIQRQIVGASSDGAASR